MRRKNLDWPEQPRIYEINTWPWLQALSNIYKHEITLNNIPPEVFSQELKFFDFIWLMGVWERSPQSREIALNHTGLQQEYHKALSDFKTEDVVGSPYSIFDYHVDPHLGGEDSLKNFRKQLTERNIQLLLDYVPNHVAIDHHWTLEKSNIFIEGTIKDMNIYPNEFFAVGNKVLAHGRDPYFTPWTDTVQINAFSSEARKKAVNILINIAEQCDGVRCDMAMLMTNDVFSRTWGERAGLQPEKDFWREVISEVLEKFPDFLFIAEVYWNMEWELQQQGFHFCYDKRLYDRMLYNSAEAIRDHLHAEWDYQRKLLRFIENHDESRAITAFGEERSQAAAIVSLPLPGAKLVHEGQMKGYKVKIPVQLGRRPVEDDNQDLLNFYQKLLSIVSAEGLTKGKWALCKIEPINTENYTYTNLISYQWRSREQHHLIVVNYSPNPAQGHVRIEELNYDTYNWSFTDLLTQKRFIYKGKDLDTNGLYIDLSAWSGHIFYIKQID